ncbi:hypothetical protein [Streptomyces griseosporeus]|uniref:hypothetical protein n=1 Tax=Streptomyces griseosporeus TaxID=1910 RepID=UPI00167C81FE|nr:hypothetical protein [Streptomyces griseosporeus]GHF80239.1 hypothetical protein GCM10018783_58310 [Streptomyces griseosporeus]
MQAQESRVTVQIVSHPTAYPEEVWEVNLEHISMSTEEILDELSKIAWAEGGEYPAHFVLRGQHGHHSWGASGSFGEFVLQLSSGMGGGLGVVAVQAAIKSTFEKIRKRAARDSWENLATEEEAQNVARMKINSHYDVALDDLTLVGSDVDAQAAKYAFNFRDAQGRSFGAEVMPLEGIVCCSRIWMRNYEMTPRPEFRSEGE